MNIDYITITYDWKSTRFDTRRKKIVKAKDYVILINKKNPYFLALQSSTSKKNILDKWNILRKIESHKWSMIEWVFDENHYLYVGDQIEENKVISIVQIYFDPKFAKEF